MKKRIYSDFTLSLIASCLTTGFSQLFLYPFFSRILDASSYGTLLTVVSVAITISTAVGGTLNNARLLRESKYQEQHIAGDFAFLMIILSIITASAMFFYLINMGSFSGLVVLIIVFYTVMACLHNYGEVSFRIELNYQKYLVLSICLVFGEIIGVIIIYLNKRNNLWPISFAIGELACVSYIALSSKIYQEKPRITRLFSGTFKLTLTLFITQFVASALQYCDRLLLYPLMGAEAVSSYSVASFFGKSLGVLITPISGVLLSYYSRDSFKMTYKRFWIINEITLVLAAVFYVICVIVSDWATGLFYPTLIEAARPYLLIANLTGILGAVGNVINPAVLRYSSAKWQIVIQAVYGSIYVFGGVIGVTLSGIYGFCVAALIASLCRLIILFTIGSNSLKHKYQN